MSVADAHEVGPTQPEQPPAELMLNGLGQAEIAALASQGVLTLARITSPTTPDRQAVTFRTLVSDASVVTFNAVDLPPVGDVDSRTMPRGGAMLMIKGIVAMADSVSGAESEGGDAPVATDPDTGLTWDLLKANPRGFGFTTPVVVGTDHARIPSLAGLENGSPSVGDRYGELVDLLEELRSTTLVVGNPGYWGLPTHRKTPGELPLPATVEAPEDHMSLGPICLTADGPGLRHLTDELLTDIREHRTPVVAWLGVRKDQLMVFGPNAFGEGYAMPEQTAVLVDARVPSKVLELDEPTREALAVRLGLTERDVAQVVADETAVAEEAQVLELPPEDVLHQDVIPAASSYRGDSGSWWRRRQQ